MRWVLILSLLIWVGGDAKAEDAKVDDEVLYLDHVATAKKVKVCVEKVRPQCVSPWLSNARQEVNPNWVHYCMLTWRVCEGEPSNIVQKSAKIAPAVILKKLGIDLEDLAKLLKARFDDSLTKQEERFSTMMRKLGLDDPKPQPAKPQGTR